MSIQLEEASCEALLSARKSQTLGRSSVAAIGIFQYIFLSSLDVTKVLDFSVSKIDAALFGKLPETLQYTKVGAKKV